MDGRILGYLIIMNAPYISSAELGKVLNASAGSVSMATRRMVDAGFIKRHVVPGDRSHYFRADDDPWGSFLAGERRYLDRQRELLERGLDVIGDADTEARERLRRLWPVFPAFDDRHRFPSRPAASLRERLLPPARTG